MSKKNIDKLFQEKLKDFNEIPEKHVWSDITHSLDKKKSRKIIPFWWKLGGVAAVIAVLFTLFNPLEDKNTIAPVITETESVKQENSIREDAKTKEFEVSTEDQIEIVNTDAIEVDSKLNSDEIIDANKTESKHLKKQSDLITTKKTTTKTTQITTIDSRKKIENNKAFAKVNEKDIGKNNLGLTVAIVENNKIKSEEKESKKILSNISNQNTIETNVTNIVKEEQSDETENDNKKKSIFDEIEKQKEEKEILADNAISKWSVGANLAPVYFNSFGEGSSIDPSFNTNSKSGAVNMSYGLSVAYDVSNKLSVRTGVNKVNYGYNTNEVEFSASLQGSLSSRLNNVNYTESAENVAIGNKSENISSLANRSSDVIANNNSRNGVMAQEFGYIEVPVELDYAIIQSRFGVNLVGGISTLFLTNNSVALNGSDEIIELGEANNLNDVNFSTNVGFGLNYKFSSKIRFNVEPVFKYQLGTFSDTSGSFNPFSVGIYSGLNFKF